MTSLGSVTDFARSGNYGYVTLKSGGTLVESLMGFVAVVVAGTLLHGLVVLPLIARFIAGVDVLDFFRKAARPLLVAFATSSSAATLPISMQTAEDEFGVSDTVTGFVFPLGATMNMDGTALYEGIAAVFMAYLFGIDLTTTSRTASDTPVLVAVRLLAQNTKSPQS